MKEKKKTKAELELEALQNNKRQGRSNPKGTEQIKKLERKFNVVFSPIDKVNPSILKDNLLNTYAPLDKEELEEMAEDIKRNGIVVPLIATLDEILICGHNRKKASLLAGIEEVPVIYLEEPRNPNEELIKSLMKSENVIRRGGKWSKEKKEEFIEENFLETILQTNQGGNNKEKENLAKKIEEMTKGKIGESTAKQIISLIKKKHSPGKSKVKITLKTQAKKETTSTKTPSTGDKAPSKNQVEPLRPFEMTPKGRELSRKYEYPRGRVGTPSHNQAIEKQYEKFKGESSKAIWGYYEIFNFLTEGKDFDEFIEMIKKEKGIG